MKKSSTISPIDLYVCAQAEVGVAETSGVKHTTRIVEYHQTTALQATSDETPWCASFVNWCLKQCGIEGTNSAWARSFLGWGQNIPLREAQKGDIVVLSRGTNNRLGHVAFYHAHDKNYVMLLGGNQSNRVKVSSYPISRILSVRRMLTTPLTTSPNTSPTTQTKTSP
jgi:uncharacterized protein (TIGR02594 family)